MKKALACALSLALLLSLSACHKPQQPDNSQPDNSAATSTEPDVSTPEPEDNIPEPAPQKAPALEQLSDTTPAVPAENENPQGQSEPAAQEPAVQELVSELVQPETLPVTADTKPAEPAQEQQPPAEQPPEAQQTEEQKTIDQMIADSQRRGEEARQAREAEAKGSGVTLEEAQKNGSQAYFDEYGNLVIPGAREKATFD